MKKGKKMNKSILSAAVFSLMMGVASAKEAPTPGYKVKIPEQIMTPDKVQSRIGELNFYDGMPTAGTVEKIYDNLDYLRGIDVFLNFIPACSIEAMRVGNASLGVSDYNQVLLMDKLMDSTSLFLTGNTDTVYASSFFDLSKTGPMVVEIPPGAGPGTVNDAFFRFVVDMGAPGPDRKKGGTYIILPPDYEGDLKPTPNTFKDNSSAKAVINGEEREVWIAKSRSNTNWMILRGFLVDGKPDAAAAMWREKLKIYPLKDAANPKPMEFVSGSGKYFNTIHSNQYSFFEELNDVIQREPISFISPELRGQAAAIGIVKGKPFAPDARMKKILTEAVEVANATARTISFNPRDKRAYLYPNSSWKTFFIGGDYRWLDQTGEAGRNLDARIHFFYQATVNTPAMALQLEGVGSNYVGNTRDSDGNMLLGDKSYRLNLPRDVPAKDFWSLVVYDPQTRSELQTPDQPFPSINSKIAKLDYNEDGSVDVYFGPKAPKGHENNWIQTVPGKAWFVVMRFYGPLKPFYDKSWKPGEIELIK
jgi:hypothetical protein